ncbi:MAG: ABC transporter substrate-binding protein, partial [Bosea sp.]|nr:ABC transporter substrate-binding protein [Bosea sp. (in: a-proteobacteria)]
MARSLSRRAFVGASAAALSLASGARAPAFAQQKTSISVRIERDITALDPAFRGGPHDANVIRCVFQRLAALKLDGSGLELDAASELKQVSPTLIEFTLKPGQMFTDGFGEMTAEDVKFSYERFAVAPVDGKVSPYKADWSG